MTVVTSSTPTLRLRAATRADIAVLGPLIERSVRELSVGFYTPAQIESGLRHLFGVDSQLVADGTYYVVETGSGIAAAGGWSARRTLFGGDGMKSGADTRLDPATDPARIRAFFVDPEWARRGFARLLFARCQSAARDAGFGTFELMATLPGEPFYASLGFAPQEQVAVRLPDGLELPCVRMTRLVDDPWALGVRR